MESNDHTFGIKEQKIEVKKEETSELLEKFIYNTQINGVKLIESLSIPNILKLDANKDLSQNDLQMLKTCLDSMRLCHFVNLNYTINTFIHEFNLPRSLKEHSNLKHFIETSNIYDVDVDALLYAKNFDDLRKNSINPIENCIAKQELIKHFKAKIKALKEKTKQTKENIAKIKKENKLNI